MDRTLVREWPQTQPPVTTRTSASRDSHFPAISVVVVHFETLTELQANLRSVARAADGIELEVAVVDNGSAAFHADAVRRLIPDALVVRNVSNLGFARAANQALRQARGRYLLLLNPDTVLASDSLRAMIAYMDAHPGVGCATARLVMPDGRLDLACRRLFPTPERSFYRLTLLSRLFPHSRRFGQYNMTYLDEFQETEIDAPCGAFMMVRREAVTEVGLLDERYFLYGEDLDWAYRIKRAGWRVMYTPITTVTHIKRASSRKQREPAIRAFYQAMRIFYSTHLQPNYPRPVTWLTYAGIRLREALELTSARLGSKGNDW